MREITEKEKEIMKNLCIETQAFDEFCEEPSKRFKGCENICFECQKNWLLSMGWEKGELPTQFKSIF